MRTYFDEVDRKYIGIGWLNMRRNKRKELRDVQPDLATIAITYIDEPQYYEREPHTRVENLSYKQADKLRIKGREIYLKTGSGGQWDNWF